MIEQSENITKNNRTCANCIWSKSHEEGYICNNSDSKFYRQSVTGDYKACISFECIDQEPCDDIITDYVIGDESSAPTITAASKDKEQINKNITLTRAEIEYDGNKSVICMIINAISIRINMPRGTLKVLMACFAALVVASVTFAINASKSGTITESGSTESGAGGETVSEEIVDGDESNLETKTMSKKTIPEEKRIPISANYSYVVPEGSEKEVPWLEGYGCMNPLAYSFYDGDGYWTLVRSFTMEPEDDGFEKTVQKRLQGNDEIMDGSISFRYEDANDVRFYTSSFEALDADNLPIRIIEYSWMDDGVICSLEVSTARKDNEETASAVRNTIHKADNSDKLKESSYPEGYDSNNPVAMGEADAQAVYDGMMKEQAEQAMLHDIQDAWRDYTERPEPIDYPW